MNLITKFLDKNNLHHAYLIEGMGSEVVEEITKFAKSLGVETVGNPDFIHIQLDSFKIEDARNLKSYTAQKGFSSEKKIFIVSANNFLLEAQNSLLKTFEEPIENTFFFLIVPDANILLKTLISRFYLIKTKTDLAEASKEAEKFIAMSLKDRIDFIKNLLAEKEEENEDEDVPAVVGKDSSRSKALKFLSELEISLHKKSMSKMPFDTKVFEHFFKVREFLRMPGSSVKSLLESVALVTPEF